MSIVLSLRLDSPELAVDSKLQWLSFSTMVGGHAWFASSQWQHPLLCPPNLGCCKAIWLSLTVSPCSFFQHPAVSHPPCLDSLLHYSTPFFHQSLWSSLHRLVLFNQRENTLISAALLSTDYLRLHMPSREPNQGFWQRFFFPQPWK